MSDRIVNTPPVNPLENHQVVYPPISTSQTNAELTTTSTTGTDTSTPTLTNKEVLQSPLEASVELTASASLAFEHSAPEAQDKPRANSPRALSVNAESQIIHKNSINVLKEAALSGDVIAQFDLGMCYFSGEGVEKDHTQASIYFQLAASQGDADAQYNLGTLFLRGEGVEKNLSRALFWYRQAAQQNHPDAQYNVGLMYRLGDGVPKDDIKAAYYFRDSAYRGNTNAQWQMGIMYENGLGVERDEKKAFDLYLKAANKDNANAQFEVGRMYANGTVVVQDDDQAFKWLSKAEKQGLHVAQIALVCYYTKSSEKSKDLYLASYQLLKSGLSLDGASISLSGFRNNNFTISSLVKFFPELLIKFPEFEKVRSMVFFFTDTFSDKFSAIGDLIRSNTNLVSLCVLGDILNNADAHILAQALENNTNLIELTYVGTINVNIENKILKSLHQNRSIAKLRQHMLRHPIKRTDILPLEVLEILVDKMIVSYLKSGHSLNETINAINEFLVSAGINGIMMDLKNN